MNKIKMLVVALSIFLSIIILAIGFSNGFKTEMEPPIWRVSKGKDELLVIATIYNTPKEKAVLGDKTKKNMKNADYLLVAQDSVKDATYYTNIDKTNRFKSTIVNEFLSENEKEKLKEICDILGIEYKDIIKKSTGEALNIILAYKKRYVYQGEQVRVKTVIIQEFYNDNKRVYECENYDEQQEMLNCFETFLIENNKFNFEDDGFKKIVNSDFKKNLEQFKNLYISNQEAYEKGDIDKLEQSITNSDFDIKIYENVLKERNKMLYKKITNRCRHKEGVPLLAFEVNTLLGEYGILNLFANDGYLVEKIN